MAALPPFYAYVFFSLPWFNTIDERFSYTLLILAQPSFALPTLLRRSQQVSCRLCMMHVPPARANEMPFYWKTSFSWPL